MLAVAPRSRTPKTISFLGEGFLGRAMAVPKVKREELDAGQRPSRSAGGQSCVAYPACGPGIGCWVPSAIFSSRPITIQLPTYFTVHRRPDKENDVGKVL